ncbi:methionine synthase [Actinokineospora fastidiosa]|uniref:Methionine synthase n=1 Tax=Actinokineospora fastidiosa TaxID=1816 RepID=A0A918GPG2_9PSEU|nr:methionine synthase [Actinokineospora fastidiosa]GGS52452.1 methionine synthase [Actinokineospora fastidiosa]
MSTAPWAPGAATGIGSLPGREPVEAAAVVLGELPEFPHIPELPARGLGADILGRGAALLVDIAVELVPSGYRITARPGGDHRRAVDLLRRDLDAVEEAIGRAGAAPPVLKLQLPGPWTLTAGIELPRGHRVITDHGALRDVTASLAEGVTQHVADARRRTGAEIVVQFDEPGLPAVLNGTVPTPSGYGTVPAVAEPEAREVLSTLVETAREATGQPVIVHCCAPRPPISLLRSAGADAIAFDATLAMDAAALDEIGEAWEDGTVLFLGVIPGVEPAQAPTLRAAADPALRLVDRLGFPRTILAERAVPTPSCGLAGATPDWARRAMTLVRDVGKAFVEPPESW